MPEGTGKRQKLQFIGGTLRRKAEFFDAEHRSNPVLCGQERNECGRSDNSVGRSLCV
jgi:hypothetical protein